MPLPIKFNPKVASQLEDRAALAKLKKLKKSKPKSNSVIDIIERIRQDVEENLGQFRNDYRCIMSVDELKDYIQKAEEVGELSLDTETDGLNPLVDMIVGLCLYFPGGKPVYVPINHVDYFSDQRIEGQLTEEQVRECLELFTGKYIMHNAPFDIRVVKHQVGIKLKIYWDALPASQIIEENESHKLKDLHGKYISHTKEKTFDELFGKLPFKYVPIEYAYLYGAHDAIDTYELMLYQLDILTQPGFEQLMWLYRNIEIPMIDVIIDLEDTGVAVDTEYLSFLHKKYNEELDKAEQACQDEIETCYAKEIATYNAEAVKKFTFPVNIGSQTQLATLFFDILKISKPIKEKKDRCMDEDVMQALSSKHSVAKHILDYRGAKKITSTYVDNIPQILHTDGRVHTHFSSNGAKTGRMSSSDPLNLQNIPSHNEDIRKMFIGQTTTRDVVCRSDGAHIFERTEEIELDTGWQWVELVKPGDHLVTGETVKVVKSKSRRTLIAFVESDVVVTARTRRIIQGSDYSAQEPRVLAQLCEDEGMLAAYRAGKDLYVEIASISFHKPYKFCLEHFPKGCPIKQNAEGKWEYALLKTGEDDGKLNFEDLKYDEVNLDDYDYDKLADGETDVYKVGKEFRGQAKRILLGIMYGRGERSIAEQLECDIDEAREIKNNVYSAFPKIKVFERDSATMVHEKGYVTTLWGRRRHLGDYNLPNFEFYYLYPDKDVIDETRTVPDSIASELRGKLANLRWKKKDEFIKSKKENERILIVDNNSKIAAAGRQIINSRVQGSAADMSKLALIKIKNDEELTSRGVRLIIPVHDEILIETPLRYARYVKERFAYDMETAAKPVLTIPVSCDVVSAERWYGDEMDLNTVLAGLVD